MSLRVLFLVCSILLGAFPRLAMSDAISTAPTISYGAENASFASAKGGIFKFELSNGLDFSFSRTNSIIIAMIPGGSVYFADQKRCSAPVLVVDLLYPSLAEEIVEAVQPGDYVRQALTRSERICRGDYRDRVAKLDLIVIHKDRPIASYDATLRNRKWGIKNRKLDRGQLLTAPPTYIRRIFNRGAFLLRHENGDFERSLASLDNGEVNFLRGVRSEEYDTIFDLNQVARVKDLEFVEPYFQRSLDMGYPLSYFAKAYKVFIEIGSRNLPSADLETRDEFRLLLAKSAVTGYVDAFDIVQKVENFDLDMQTALQVVREKGLGASVLDLRAAKRIEAAPNPSQVGRAMQQLLLRNNCSFAGWRLSVPIVSLRPAAGRCVQTTPGIGSLALGVGRIRRLSCSGTDGSYFCEFGMTLSCRTELLDGVQVNGTACSLIPLEVFSFRGKFQRSAHGNWSVSRLN